MLIIKFLMFSVFSLLNTEFAKYNTDKVCQWLEQRSFEIYLQECKNWIKNGLQLLQATTHDYEKVMQNFI